MIDISKISAHGSHFASYRTTKYEVGQLAIGPNELGVVASERDVPGSAPIPIKVHEDVFGDTVRVTLGGNVIDCNPMDLFHAAFSLAEEGFRIVHDAKEAELKLAGIDIPRAEVHALVKQAEEAKAAMAAAQTEAARIEAENIVKRAEAEQLDADLATMRAAAAEAEKAA